MRVMFDLTDVLQDWTSLLEDLQCDMEDLYTAIMYYDPMSDALFLDDIIESEDPSFSDDVIHYIKASAQTLLRNRLDEYMRYMGYEVIRIINVFMTNLRGTILSVIDVLPIDMRREFH